MSSDSHCISVIVQGKNLTELKVSFSRVSGLRGQHEKNIVLSSFKNSYKFIELVIKQSLFNNLTINANKTISEKVDSIVIVNAWPRIRFLAKTNSTIYGTYTGRSYI